MDAKKFDALLEALGKGKKAEEERIPKSQAEIKARLGKILHSIATEGRNE